MHRAIRSSRASRSLWIPQAASRNSRNATAPRRSAPRSRSRLSSLYFDFRDGGGAVGWGVGVTGAGVEASSGGRRGVVERVGWVGDGGVGGLRVLK